MNKPVILVIENAIDVTGSLNSVLRSCAFLREQYEFLFILPRGSRATKLVSDEGFQVFEFPMTEIRKSFFPLIMYWPTLFRNAILLRAFILKHKVRLILNNDFYNLLPAAYQLIGGNVKYLCYVRFLPSKFPQALVGLWFKTHACFADKLIAVSNVVKEQLPVNTKVVVIGNELPLVSLPLSIPDSKIILYPSNFIHGKGHEHAVKLLATLPDDFKQWRIRFIGSDMGLKKNAAFRKSLIQLATELGVLNQTEWLDFDGRIIDHYFEAAIVLNFSESESFSMTCLEAMFYGRPVIATRSGGPQEIIVDGENGLLVDVGNLPQMTAALRKLIESERTRQHFGVAAYHHVRQKFSAANTIGKLFSLYQSSL